MSVMRAGHLPMERHMPNAIATIGATLLATAAFTLAAAAQTSCSEWNSTCLAHAKASGNLPTRCESQFAQCRKTGCWTEAASQGGAKHCNLKKS
jgi:hypothetical protein